MTEPIVDMQCQCLDDLDHDPIIDTKEKRKQKLALRAEWINDLTTKNIEYNIKTMKWKPSWQFTKQNAIIFNFKTVLVLPLLCAREVSEDI